MGSPEKKCQKKRRKARSSSSSSHGRRKQNKHRTKRKKSKAKTKKNKSKKHRISKKRRSPKPRRDKESATSAAENAQKQMRLAQIRWMQQMGWMPPFGPHGALPQGVMSPPSAMPPPDTMPPHMIPQSMGPLPVLPQLTWPMQTNPAGSLEIAKPKQSSSDSSSSSDGVAKKNNESAILETGLAHQQAEGCDGIHTRAIVAAQVRSAELEDPTGTAPGNDLLPVYEDRAAGNDKGTSSSSSDSDSSSHCVNESLVGACQAAPGITHAVYPGSVVDDATGIASLGSHGTAPIEQVSTETRARRRRRFDISPARTESSDGVIRRVVETVTLAMLPPPPPPNLANISIEVDAFLQFAEVDQQAATQLRTLYPHLQRQVLDTCDLSNARNKSAVLIARIRDAKAEGPAHQAQPSQLGPAEINSGTLPAFLSATQEEVNTFCIINCIDPDAAVQLKIMPAELQRKVLERGDLSHARNPSAVLIARMRDAKSGTSHQDGLGMPAPAPTGNCHPGIEAIISRFSLDARCAQMLRNLPRHKQDVAATIDLTLARRPSAYVMSKLAQGFGPDIPTTLTIPAFGVVGSQVV